MGLRRKSREIALQFLFGHDFQEQPNDTESLGLELQRFCDCFEAGEKALPYARELILGISQRTPVKRLDTGSDLSFHRLHGKRYGQSVRKVFS